MKNFWQKKNGHVEQSSTTNKPVLDTSVDSVAGKCQTGEEKVVHVKSANGAFTMRITQAEEDEDKDSLDTSDSSSSDSSSDSDSSSSDSECEPDNIAATAAAKQNLGRTKLVKSILGSEMKKVEPHVPMIRFRKNKTKLGNIADKVIVPSVPSVEKSVSRNEVLEWWQLPKKYKKREIQTNEIEVINAGGADTIFQ